MNKPTERKTIEKEKKRIEKEGDDFARTPPKRYLETLNLLETKLKGTGRLTIWWSYKYSSKGPCDISA